MVLFGQVVVGPPGSGKTSYCHGMSMLLANLQRKYAIVNLDFANDIIPYVPDIDVRELITLEVKERKKDYFLFMMRTTFTFITKLN